jgi:hypothetical protein
MRTQRPTAGLPLMPPELPHRVGCCGAVLSTTDVQGCGFEIDLPPPRSPNSAAQRPCLQARITIRLLRRPQRLPVAVSTGFTALHTVPELALGGDDQVLMVERIGRGGDLDPFAPVVITKNVVRQVLDPRGICYFANLAQYSSLPRGQ